MLWPFSRRKMEMPKIRPEFLPIVLSDLDKREDNFLGYVQVVGSDMSYTVLVHDGVPVQHVFSASDGTSIPAPGIASKAIMDRIGSVSTMLVMELDQLPAVSLATIFSRRPDLVGGKTAECWNRMLEQAVMESDLFIVNIIEGIVNMPAVVQQGEVVQWLRFDADTREYVVEHDSDVLFAFCEKNAERLRFAFYLDPMPWEQDIGYTENDDPFICTAKSYFDIFEEIKTIIVREDRDRAAKELYDLLKSLREKYPPLYQGIFINPETLDVNWERILQNRRKISHKFRYEPFFIYLDELLLMLIRKHYAIMGVRGIVELIRFVEQKRRNDMLAKSTMEDNFYTKIAGLLHMDRLNSGKAPAGA